MPRVVRPDQYSRRHGAFLDAAQRLLLTKGYERMTIQDILDLLGASKGAFYHYFQSKAALLEAFIQRIREETEEPLSSIANDPHLSAVEKLRGFFAALSSLKLAHRREAVELAQGWYTDDNALVRQKVDEALARQRAPLLSRIVRQGIEEGVFTISYPDQAGEVIMSLLLGMGHSSARLVLSMGAGAEKEHMVERILAVQHAYMEAIERVLGAPPNSIHRSDAAALMAWMEALGKERG